MKASIFKNVLIKFNPVKSWKSEIMVWSPTFESPSPVEFLFERRNK
jgi:hypothetical protein